MVPVSSFRCLSKKLGGNPINLTLADGFKESIQCSNFLDLGFEGDIFTWYNNQQDEGHIKPRRVRCLASPLWITNFSKAMVFHLLRYSSNHNPLLIENVTFLKKDIYNQVDKERRSKGGDSRVALAYLRSLMNGDLDMHLSHIVDAKGRL